MSHCNGSQVPESKERGEETGGKPGVFPPPSTGRAGLKFQRCRHLNVCHLGRVAVESDPYSRLCPSFTQGPQASLCPESVCKVGIGTALSAKGGAESPLSVTRKEELSAAQGPHDGTGDLRGDPS